MFWVMAERAEIRELIKVLDEKEAIISYLQEKKDRSVDLVLVSQEERALLEKLVHAEAAGEPYEGQIAVANVVFNRLESSLFPQSIKDIIFQKKQFPVAHTGSIHRIMPSENVKEAVRDALEGRKEIESDVLFFLNENTATDKWITRNRLYSTTIGKHAFYK